MAGRGCQNALFFMYVPFFEVQFSSENFSLYTVMVGLRNFSRYNVRAQKKRRSAIFESQQFEGPPSSFFSEFLHRNTVYEKLA